MEELSFAAAATTAPVPAARAPGLWVPWPGGTALSWSTMPVWERLGRILLVILLIAGLPIAVARVVQKGCTDFTGFCDAGRYVIEQGCRDPKSTLGRYWPSADVPWMFFAQMPIGVAAVLWYLVGCASWLALLDTICRWMLTDRDAAARRQATLAAGLLATPLALDGMCLGSFHILMVWLMISGLYRATHGRTWSGGVLLGMAAWLKLLPFLGTGFLLLHRKTTAALIAIGVSLVLDVVLSVGAFGLEGAWREHVAWWQEGAAGTADRQLSTAMESDEDRLTNQSIAVTLRRFFTSLGTAPDSPRNCVEMADLTATQLKAVFAATMGLLVLGLAIYCWPATGPLRAVRTPPKIAMMVLATLWLSPVVWSYHYVAATPALAILLNRCQQRWRPTLWVAAAWVVPQCLLVFPLARAAGVLLWMSLLVGAGLIFLRPEAEGGVVGG